MNYDTSLFIEIIESAGAKFLRSDCIDGVHARCYEGKRGNLVVIDTTDEEMDDSTAKGLLTQLGFAELIPSLFPVKVAENIDDLRQGVGAKNP